MCLHYDEETTKKGLKGKHVDEDGLVKVWKILKTDIFVFSHGKFLVSPLKHHTWKGGWNKSDRAVFQLSTHEKVKGIVDKGIHVLLTRKEARKYVEILRKHNCENTIVVPVYVKAKDLVAAGHTCLYYSDCKDHENDDGWQKIYKRHTATFSQAAVFTSVFLKKEDKLKATK